MNTLSNSPRTYRLLVIDAEHPNALELATEIRKQNKEIEIVFWGEVNFDISKITTHNIIPKERVPDSLNRHIIEILRVVEDNKANLRCLPPLSTTATTARKQTVR